MGLRCCKTPHPTSNDNSNGKKSQQKNKRKSILNLKIFTLNTQSLASRHQLLEFEEKAEKLNFDIIGMSETRIFREKLIKKRDGHYVFHSSPTRF